MSLVCTTGLHATNFAGDTSREQDSSTLGQPPTDYQTPAQHAQAQREAQGSTPPTAGSSSGSAKHIRSPLLDENPISDAAVNIARDHPDGAPQSQPPCSCYRAQGHTHASCSSPPVLVVAGCMAISRAWSAVQMG